MFQPFPLRTASLALITLLSLSACVTVTEENLNVPNPAPGVGPHTAVEVEQTLMSPPRPTHQPVHRPAGGNATGEVMVQVLVNADGTAGDRVLVQSSGSATLDEAALSSVGEWQFEPARDTDGQAMNMIMVVPVRFH